MFLLSKTIEINFDFSSLIIYLSGILTGIILASLIYVLLVLLSLNKSKKIIESSETLKEDDLRVMIENSKEKYKLLKKSSDPDVKEGAFKEVILSLVNDIATKCFPKSKNPMFELSIDEAILLSKYVIQRLEEVLDKKAVRLIKRISIARVYKLLNIKKKIDNNTVVKEVKKHSKIVKIGLTVVSTITKPFKLIGRGTKNMIINKILLVTISIVGEEAYKIYTKQVIRSMDPEYIKLMEDIDKEILDVEEVVE